MFHCLFLSLTIGDLRQSPRVPHSCNSRQVHTGSLYAFKLFLTECRDIVFSPDSLKVTLGVSRRRVILDRCCFLFMWAFGCWGCLLFVLWCLPSALPGCSGLWFEMSRSRSHRMYEIEPAIQVEVRPSFDQGILGDRADRIQQRVRCIGSRVAGGRESVGRLRTT